EHFVAVFDDISARRGAQEALQASEHEQRQLAQQLEIERSRLVAAQRVANIGSWETDLSSLEVAWSEETHRIFETDPATCRPTHAAFMQFVHPDDRPRVDAAFELSRDQHYAQELEHRVLMPDGRIKFVEERWQIFFGEDGKPMRALGTCQDISERKRSERALQESRQRLALATEAAHLGIWDWDVIANTTLWDPQMYALYGVREHEVASAHDAWERGLHPDDRQRIDAEIAAAVATGADLDSEFRIVRPGGELRDMHTHAVTQFDGTGSAVRMIGVNRDITERKQAQTILHDSEARFRQMAESISDVFFLREAGSGRMLYISPAYGQIFGRSLDSLYADQEAWSTAVHPDDLSGAMEAYKSGLATGKAQYEYRIVRPDGTIRWIETRTFPVGDLAGGKFDRIAGITKDVTERKRADARITYLTRVYAMLSGVNSLISRVPDREALFQGACRVAVEEGGFRKALICIVDPKSEQLTVTASAGMSEQFLLAIEGLLSSNETAPHAIVTRAVKLKQTLVSNDSQFDPRVLLGRMHAESGIHSIAVFPLVVADKAVASLTLYANEVEFFHEDELKLLTGLAGDIAFAIDHIQKAERLDYLAYYDALTGLPNRSLFLERVAQSMRGEGVGTFSMVLFDLERFKHFNDSLGRPAGDALLLRVVDRLKRTMLDASLLARVGADQFALVIPKQEGESGQARFVEKTNALLQDSFRLDGAVIRVAAKFGIARFPDDGADAESLFKNAEVALKLAKSSGERFAHYSSEMNARNALRLVLEEQLRAAVDARQFVLYYQARVDMISGEIVGAEALIRWLHPVKGLVAPGEFIALAEETGLIVPIGAWVIDSVCSQQAEWLAAGISIVPIAVNLSAFQFSTGDLRQTVCDALTAHSLEAKYLELELTESAVMKDSGAASKVLHALRKLGVSLALDDFGTGYSSLSHLKSFPFSAVKIDRSFVTDITSKPEDAAIAAAIIAMAHGLGLTAIAEGVETEGQFNYLRALGCDEMQGYFFSRPAPVNEFGSQLRNRERLALPVPTATDQRTLLLVDDEQSILSALTRVMRRDGYRILTATTGREGLELLALNHVQVIISDQRMPGMSGTEFLNAVKQLYPDTMRIILSGYTDLEVVTDSVNRGAVFKFLTKPWDDKLLLDQVRDAFRRYRPSNAAA
ncbi:MAG TPA: EAL domain-containing protein, partial [Rhodanobacteraceae bacterium]|nr:EAL domain-containing protein [Rhodanobacteraceae bacterium]